MNRKHIGIDIGTTSICGIGLGNFTPDRLTAAFLRGICDELYGFYSLLPESLRTDRTEVVGSGNGLRKNPLLRRLLVERFQLPVNLPPCEEEAALGAAIHLL